MSLYAILTACTSTESSTPMRTSHHTMLTILCALLISACSQNSNADTRWQATMVSQQQTIIELMRVTPAPIEATSTSEPHYQATAVALVEVALTAQAQISTDMGTQTAQNTSLIRLAQTNNALTESQNALLRTVRENSAQSIKLQSTAISLAAAANAIANKQLGQATTTDATMVAVQRGQTQVLAAQLNTLKTVAYETALTSYYSCLAIAKTNPGAIVSCTKPKK